MTIAFVLKKFKVSKYPTLIWDVMMYDEYKRKVLIKEN